MGNFCSKTSSSASNQKHKNNINTIESPVAIRAMEESKKRKLSDSEDISPRRKKRKTETVEKHSNKDTEGTATSNQSVQSMTKMEFLNKAQDMEAVLKDRTFLLKARTFSTGSVGWFVNSHELLGIDSTDSKKVDTVLGISAVVNGSKKWKEGIRENQEEDEDEDDDLKELKVNETEKKKKQKTKEEGDTMTKMEFVSNAEDFKVECFGKCINLKAKQSSKGSVGWNGNSRVSYHVEGYKVMVSISVNITVKKSKEWEEGGEEK